MKFKRVTIDVQGGIGNQLFMYFAGLYWAQENDVELVVNLGKIGIFGVHHGSELDEFELDCKVTRDAPSLLKAFVYRVRKRMFRSRFGSILDRVIKFRTFYSSEIGYDGKLETRKHLRSIEGYFQTYKYFDGILNPNFKNLKLRNGSLWFEETRKILRVSPFIALHVRRGDFKNYSNSVGLLSNEYYSTAIREVDLILGEELAIIVFSDEPKLAREVLAEHEFRVSRWITQPQNSSPIESLLLMSEAHAIVIANSTFSWWAAKLGRSKLVIAPKQWFRLGESPKDLYPADWHLVPSSWET
jgi:hypothetical protein